MKIYEIGTGYTPIPAQIGAATEIVVEELAKAFLNRGEDVQIIDIAACDRSETDLPIREVRVPGYFRGTDIKLGIMHKLKRVVYSISLAGVLQNLLKQEEGKVILHFHNQYNLFFFLKMTSAKLRKKAVIAYTNHSGIWRQEWSSIASTIQKRYFQEAECMRLADIVFLLNDETKQNVRQYLGVPEEKIILIGNGVNTDIYHPLSPAEKEKAKEKWGFRDCRVILQVGSVNENKGQLRSAAYLLPILRKYPNLIFAYAGGIAEEEYQDRITDFAMNSGVQDQIRYLGMINPGEQLNDVYNTAEATIFPSIFEAFGLVAIESMAAGVPVLLDKKSPISFGTGSAYYNSDNFLEIVEHLLNNRDEQFQMDARNNAVNQYSWKKIASDYLEAFSRGGR